MSTEFQQFITQFTELLLDQIQGKMKLVLLDKAFLSGKKADFLDLIEREGVVMHQKPQRLPAERCSFSPRRWLV